MKIKDALKIEKFVSGLKRLRVIRFKVSHASLIRGSVLFLILLIAFILRLLPIRWGFYLNEFDPYLQYRLTKYITDNGFLSWTSWRDYMSWYPWGRDIPNTAYPGVALTAATLYLILKALGVPLVPYPSLDPLLSDPVYNLCVIFPVIMGTITCLVIYFLGKDLGGEAVGIFAALFLALDSSYLARTTLGFFDDETVGIFSILLFIIFFIRSIDSSKPMKTSLLYATTAGLSLGYLCASWGAQRYPIDMTVLFVLVLLVIRRYSPRLLLSYGITFGLALFIATNVPYLGSRMFVFESSILPVYGVLFLLFIAEINRRAKTPSKKLIYFSIFVALLGAIFIFLWSRGMIKPLETKFMSVLNPYQRTSFPLVESVAEHRPSAWGTFYYNFGIGIFFVPVGLFFAALTATNLGIFMAIYCLTSVYFASSMIRLNILMSPALCLLWALALTRLLKPFVLFLKETPQTATRKIRFKQTLGKELIGGVLLVMFIFFALTYVIGTDFMAGPKAQGPRIFAQAYSPTTIAASSMPIIPSSASSDWLKALTWMREKLPPSPRRPGESGTVVACWWDYGYWITIIANKTTLADNGTINSTQIKQIARMFMSPEDEAIEILKKYNATHVVVFTTVYYKGLDMPWGEVGKFKWMIKIAGLNESDFGKDVSSGTTSYWQWSAEGQNTTLYKMMTYGKYALGISLIDGAGNSIEPVFPSRFYLVYPTKLPEAVNGYYYALILVYEVEY